MSINKTPAQAFTLPAEKKIGTKWALCTTAQAGNIKSGYLRILSYIAVVLCLVIGQLHVLDQGFQNKPAAAGAPAGVTRFTAGYFVLVL